MVIDNEILFERWYEKNLDELKNKFVLDNPEDFGWEEKYTEIENNARFQDYIDKQFKEVNENGKTF